MQPEVPRSNLRGFTDITSIMAFCDSEAPHQGGAYAF